MRYFLTAASVRVGRGFSMIEACVVLAILALGLSCVLPVLAQVRDDEREVTCVDNLHQLAVASQAYAADHNDRFFYHWPSVLLPDGKKDMSGVGFWNDDKRLGSYIVADEIEPVGKMGGEDTNLSWVVGPQVQCPQDAIAMRRSYAMNRWATGVDVPSPPEHHDVGRYKGGELFDRTVRNPSRFIVFLEALPKLDYRQSLHYRQSWIPQWTVGYMDELSHARDIKMLSAGELFGGKSSYKSLVGGQYPFNEYPLKKSPSWVIDYGRHGSNPDSLRPSGEANFVFADGSTSSLSSSVLYDPATGLSLDKFYWSEAD